jgi:hypothetical protein
VAAKAFAFSKAPGRAPWKIGAGSAAKSATAQSRQTILEIMEW